MRTAAIGLPWSQALRLHTAWDEEPHMLSSSLRELCLSTHPTDRSDCLWFHLYNWKGEEIIPLCATWSRMAANQSWSKNVTSLVIKTVPRVQVLVELWCC